MPSLLIKSTDNIGTFDEDNADIRYSIKDSEIKEMDKKYLEAVKKRRYRNRSKMVYKAANSRGIWRRQLLWKMQHTAPNSKDDVSLWGLKESGLIPNDFWAKPEYYTYTAEEREHYKVKGGIDRKV